jgi:hypothetical protein
MHPTAIVKVTVGILVMSSQLMTRALPLPTKTS